MALPGGLRTCMSGIWVGNKQLGLEHPVLLVLPCLPVDFLAWQLLGSQPSKSQLRAPKVCVLRGGLSQRKAVSFLRPGLIHLTTAFMLRSFS